MVGLHWLTLQSECRSQHRSMIFTYHRLSPIALLEAHAAHIVLIQTLRSSISFYIRYIA